MQIKFQKTGTLPLVILRGRVLFPGTNCATELNSKFAANAARTAIDDKRLLLFVTRKNTATSDPRPTELFRIGVLAYADQLIDPDGTVRLVLHCLSRVHLTKFSQPNADRAYWQAEYEALPLDIDSDVRPEQMEALVRAVKKEYRTYFHNLHNNLAEIVEQLNFERDPEHVFTRVWANVPMDFEDAQKMLEEDSMFLRMTQLLAVVKHEAEVASYENELRQTMQAGFERNQREAFMREQLRTLQEELGEDDDPANYFDRIDELAAPEEIREKLRKEANQLQKMPMASQEAYVIQNYLDTVLALPWGKYSHEKLDIKKAERILEKDHYGLKRVKERVLEALSVHIIQPELRGQIICLVGPPGVGKTSVAKSVAKALGREYVRVSLGGVRDEAEIRGHRKTYVGAMPGRIIEAIRQAGTMNPLVLLDEVDKLSGDFKGDPAAALLEVLDSAQNHAFRDHFVEVPFDLSQVMFLTTANDPAAIPGPLYDRMDVIELNSYTREEKFHIAKEHLIKKQIKENGLRANQIRVTDEAIYSLIDYYTKEAGVRNLERQIAALCRKTARTLLDGEVKSVKYTPETIEAALGPHRFTGDYCEKEDCVGIVNGLAWTSVGGVLMPLEVLTMEGKGEITLTGSLGDVMKESARLAVSYTRSVAKKYDINPELFKSKDIHIHAPEGAVPKDGPSAGVTMLTALVSALSGIPVRHDLAMTGEITLHGKVLPIGGIVEKSMAAYKNGIHTVLLPKDNIPDLDELDKTVRGDMEFIPCETVDTVLENALRPVHYEPVLEPLFPEEQERLMMPPLRTSLL
ncbi:MAG: endopeptidase La [Oscillospiraceae bacterium]|nr:endopeptidase La [Oscillospiraceae bacterium]